MKALLEGDAWSACTIKLDKCLYSEAGYVHLNPELVAIIAMGLSVTMSHICPYSSAKSWDCKHFGYIMINVLL